MKPSTLNDYKERMLRVLVHIQRHLDEELSLEALAQVACFSVYHFHRIFSGMMGESLQEYVRRLRLERAAVQLKLGRQPVTQIAFDAGYEAHEAFTRAFKADKTMKEKIDLYKLHKQDYATPRTPVLVTINQATYLAISGQGEPGGAVFTDRIGALYGVAFTIKMTRKFAGQQDYAVCKLEAQWWAAQNQADFTRLPKKQWLWKLLIRTPDFVDEDAIEKAVAVLLKRGKSPAVKEVRRESFTEGRSVQMLHVGPYEREHETITLMKAHAQRNGLKFHGRHHEIYLSDPRRVPPQRLKTLLRHPVTQA